MRTLPGSIVVAAAFALLLLVVAVPAGAQCTGLTSETPTVACPNTCTDTIDNDGDNRIDSNDSNCVEKGWRAYTPPYPVADDPCANGVDDDGDGLRDYGTLGTFVNGVGDSSCHEALCQDNQDNDGDNKIDGADEDCYCFIDVVNGLLGLNFPSNYCTANDTSFVLIGLGTQRDGCINANDKLSMLFEARLQTTANIRYDLGMWIALDGGDAGNYPSTTIGLCGRQILRPASGATGDCTTDPNTTCSTITNPGGFSPTLHDGPYRTETQTADQDRCGEIYSEKWKAPIEDAVFDLVIPPDRDTMTTPAQLMAYDVPCTDLGINPPGTAVTDGFIDIGTCASWDQQAGTYCNNFSEAFTKENPKCRCERTATDIPAPNINLTCTPGSLGSDGKLTFNESVTNTVTIPNTVANCTPVPTNPTPVERFRCGTASYVRVVIDYPETLGDINIGTATDNTAGELFKITSNGTLVWVPKNQLSPNSLGIVSPNQTTVPTLTYTFTRNTTPFNGSITFTTTMYWSNSLPTPHSDLTDAIAQTCTGCVCGAPIETTPVTLTGFSATRAGTTVRFAWSTATEAENVGFNIYGLTTDGWRRLNDNLIPATGLGAEPQSYETTLEVPADVTLFAIEDVDRNGKATRHPEVKALGGDAAPPKAGLTASGLPVAAAAGVAGNS